MASSISFTEKSIALYGARQTGGSGVPETLSSSHALAAISLTFDDNITSNEEQYLGNVMMREASVAQTDRFADVKAETVLPRLGDLFGKALFGRETAVLKFIDSIVDTNQAVTFTDTGDWVNWTGHTLVNGQPIAFSSITTTTGIAANTVYYVVNQETNRFNVAATVGGSLLPLTTNGSGVASIAAINLNIVGGAAADAVYMVVTSDATPTQLAEELSAYLNTDATPSAHAAFKGVPPVEYSFALSAKDTDTILATGLTNNVDATDLSKGGTQTALLTLNQNDQQTGALKALAILPFMEAGKFHAVVDTSLSLPQDIDIDYDYCNAKLQEAITENNWGLNNIINAERAANKLNLLDLGSNAENVVIDTLVSDLGLAKAKAVTIDTELRAAADLIVDLRHNVEQFMIADDPSGLRTQLHTDSQAVLTAVTNIQADITGAGSLNAYLGDVGTDLAAVTIPATNTAITTELQTLFDRCNDFYLKADTHQNNLPALVYSGGYDALTYATSADTAADLVTANEDMEAVVKSVTFTNEYPSSDTLTLHVRKSSMQMAGLQKTIIVTDAVATVDLMIEVGQKPKVTFNYHGNIYDIVNIPELSYPISQQKGNAAFVTKAENVRNASLQPTGEGLILNNICFSKLSATNIDGFEHQRVMTGCEDTWDISAKAGQVTITVLEPEANTDITTQFNAEDSLNQEFWFNFRQDGTSGNTVEVNLTRLILRDYKATTVNNRAAFDLNFTHTGFAEIKLA